VNWIQELSRQDCLNLASEIDQGYLDSDTPLSILHGRVGEDKSQKLKELLIQLKSSGLAGPSAGAVFRVLAESKIESIDQLPSLILSGPDVLGVPTADTNSTVQNLFRSAEEEVILAGFAIWDGKTLFADLAERYAKGDKLKIKFFIDIQYDRKAPKDKHLEQARAKFKKFHWPWPKMPEVFFDNRSLEAKPGEETPVFHAKIIAVDRKELLVTSANPTPRAHTTNIEVGVLLREPLLCRRVCDYFEGLKNRGILVPLF
jgi:phosphatidylserine/phosphatidylglycerophosphate/cardiolipin synthase-like enzyme